MKLSIIIPVYNVELFLRKCVDSCYRQDLATSEYELVLVNDGSTDGSYAIAQQLEKEVDNIVLISQPNGGLSAARNTGLRHAKGDYVWFVDSDDWIAENCLRKIVETCERDRLDMLQICAANMIGDKAIRRFQNLDEGIVKNGREILRDSLQFCAPFSIYRRKFLLNNGLWFYEGIFHEDNEFKPRAFFKAERVGSINDVLYFVNQNPNSITRSFNPKKAFDCIIVLKSLHAFQVRENPGKHNDFNNVITRTLNGALHEAIEMDSDKQTVFEGALYDNRTVYDHVCHSSQAIYRIEGLLMKLLPRKPITVYKFMNIFDRRNIKKKR